MPVAAYPTFASGVKLDAAKFEIELEDNTLSQEIEGGYTVTRPRTTRRSRKKFKVGYTNLSEVDRQTLDTFWQLVSGGGAAFTWTSPQDAVTYTVRFKGTISFKYRGHGTTQRWDCDFTLEQA